MLLILCLYLVGCWLVFSKLRLLRWTWTSGTIVVLIGAGILAVFLALFNNLTPSGPGVVVARVTEITPNVSGQVTEVAVEPNKIVRKGDLLFRIDPAPFAFKVRQLEAALVQAQQQAQQLKQSLEQANANVAGLTAQVAFSKQRLDDTQRLTQQGANTLYREQDVQNQYQSFVHQLDAAKAAQASASLAANSQVGGVNTGVAQIEAQLADARWQLEQTAIRAPSDGYATIVALAVGDRATPVRSVMSFVSSVDLDLVGFFQPNGFRTIQPGAPARIVFDFDPGVTHDSKVRDVPLGVGQGQLAVSGTLARVGSIGGVGRYPASLEIPSGIDRQRLRAGMPAQIVVFAKDAGVIGLIMSIVMWLNAYAAYL